MDRSQKTDWDNSQNESELNSDWKEREKKKKTVCTREEFKPWEIKLVKNPGNSLKITWNFAIFAMSHRH